MNRLRLLAVSSCATALLYFCIDSTGIHQHLGTWGIARADSSATLYITAVDCSARAEEIRDALASASTGAIRIDEVVVRGVPSAAAARTLDRLFHPVVLRKEGVFDKLWLSVSQERLPIVIMPNRDRLMGTPVEYRSGDNARTQFVETARALRATATFHRGKS